MTVLTVDEVIKLHEKLIAKTGGLDGVRDIGLLESAVFACSQTFDGEELYLTIIEKAAQMAFCICKNHPFVDGNKRVAVLSLLVMLSINGVTVKYTQDELINLGLGIASGMSSYHDIINWINKSPS